jgi:hypothetical protein
VATSGQDKLQFYPTYTKLSVATCGEDKLLFYPTYTKLSMATSGQNKLLPYNSIEKNPIMISPYPIFEVNKLPHDAIFWNIAPKHWIYMDTRYCNSFSFSL